MEKSIQVVIDGGVEMFDKPMPSHHWKRHRKQQVHYIHDSPFATNRQLEDQRLLMERNRNPQALIPTKVDKVRSEVIIAKQGFSRPVAVKANVLNKIVRDASGVHNYTIVAPPKMIEAKRKKEKLEADTNPKVRPYAKEAKMKPVLCSFGHRPRSASRTFHPATMRFRLKHAEIVQGGDDARKTGFGLPVSILAQVLKAPKIDDPGKLLDGDSESDNVGEQTLDQASHASASIGEGSQSRDGQNYDDLFFNAEEQKDIFKPVNSKQNRQLHHGGTGRGGKVEDRSSLDKPSWISSQVDNLSGNIAVGGLTGSPSSSKNLPPKIQYPKLEPLVRDDGRPAWDEAHHRIQRPSNYLFQLRASGLKSGNNALPLADRLKRFNSLAVAETHPVIFCAEKQQTDKVIMSGVEHKVPKAKPIKGKPLYYDPHNSQLEMVKYYRRQNQRVEKARQVAKNYQAMLSTIPQVNYFPTTELAHMREVSGDTYNNNSSSNNDANTSSIGNGAESGEDQYRRDEVGNHPRIGMSDSVSGIGGGGTAFTSNTSFYNYQKGGFSSNSLLEESDGHWQNVEANMKLAMQAARKGDTNALYQLNMQNKDFIATTATASNAATAATSNVSAGSDMLAASTPATADTANMDSRGADEGIGMDMGMGRGIDHGYPGYGGDREGEYNDRRPMSEDMLPIVLPPPDGEAGEEGYEGTSPLMTGFTDFETAPAVLSATHNSEFSPPLMADND